MRYRSRPWGVSIEEAQEQKTSFLTVSFHISSHDLSGVLLTNRGVPRSHVVGRTWFNKCTHTHENRHKHTHTLPPSNNSKVEYCGYVVSNMNYNHHSKTLALYICVNFHDVQGDGAITSTLWHF